MKYSKMIEAAEELRAEAAECLRLADELEAKAKGSSGVDSGTVRVKSKLKPKLKLKLRRKDGKQSYLLLAVQALREQKRPIHVKDLVPLVQAKRGEPTSRASVESALVRGMETARWRDVIRRTAPGTFAAN